MDKSANDELLNYNINDSDETKIWTILIITKFMCLSARKLAEVSSGHCLMKLKFGRY